MPSRRGFLAGAAGLAGTTLVSVSASAATVAERTWQRTYEPAEASRTFVHDIVRTANGFTLVGLTGGLNEYTGWVGRVDEAGRSQWHELVGTAGSALLAGAPATDDIGGVVAAGVTNMTSGGQSSDYTDPYIARVSEAGELSWARTYQPALPDGGSNAITSVADEFVVTGSGMVKDSERPWAAGVDRDGTQRWTWHDGRTGTVNIALGSAGGTFVAGSTWPAGADVPRPRGRQEAAWVARLTADGSRDWQWRVDREGGDRIEALAPHPNGGVVAVGRRGFPTDSRGVGWLVALDAAGNRRWERTYPQESWNWIHDVVSTGDGYVLVGTREVNAETDARGAWLLRVDAKGSVVWDVQAATGTRGETAHALADGGILIAGERSADNRNGNVAWLVKFGGEPAPATGDRTVVSLPSLPGWVGPALAGGTVGAVGAHAVAHWRHNG